MPTVMGIWIYDLNRDTSTRLTFDEGNENYPLWTLDGKAIVYVSGNVTRSTVYRKAADGTGKEERLGPPGTAAFAMVLVKRWENLDGNGIQYRQGLNADIESLSMENGNEWKALLRKNTCSCSRRFRPM